MLPLILLGQRISCNADASSHGWDDSVLEWHCEATVIYIYPKAAQPPGMQREVSIFS